MNMYMWPFWLKGFAKFSALPPQTLNFIFVSFVKGAGACRSQCVVGQVGAFQFVQPHDCSAWRHRAGSAWIHEQVDQDFAHPAPWEAWK